MREREPVDCLWARKSVNLTQAEIAEKAGVGLSLGRELEQGKETLQLDKVNRVLQLLEPYLFGTSKNIKKVRKGLILRTLVHFGTYIQ